MSGLSLLRVQVSVGITNTYDGCVDSAKEGTLAGLGFKLTPFNQSSNTTPIAFLDGSLKLGPSITTSGDLSTPSGYIATVTDVRFELTTPVKWVGEGARRLGVFYVQGANSFDPFNASYSSSGSTFNPSPTNGWLVAFEYTGLEYAAPAYMVGLVNKPDAPPFVVNSTWVTTVSTLITPFPSSRCAPQ